MRHVTFGVTLLAIAEASSPWQSSPDIARIKILSPKELAEERIGGADVSPGMLAGNLTSFSPPPTDGRVIGHVVYNASEHFHCKADYLSNLTLPSGGSSLTHADTPLVVMIDEAGGECSLADKILIAQDRYKAAAVIIAEDETSSAETSHVDEDGVGWQASIPSIIISSADARMLKSALTASPPPEKAERFERPEESHIIVEFIWELPRRAIVLLDLWVAPIEPGMTHFISGIALEGADFSDRLELGLHFPVRGKEKGDEEDSCIGDDRMYCSADPDVFGALTGADVVTEAMRQLCILDGRMEGSRSGVIRSQAEYWTYITGVLSQCDPSVAEAFAYSRCADTVANSILSSSASASYAACMSKSRGRALLKKQTEATIHRQEPALAINGVAFNGLTERSVLRKTLCRAFSDPPLVCVAQEHKHLIDPLIAKPENADGENEKILQVEQDQVAESFSIFFITLSLALSLITLCGFLLLRRLGAREKLRASVAEDVKSILAEYHAMLP